MARASTQFRLGLFAIGGIAGVFIAALVLGWSRSREDMVRYQTYFDESVQGLDLGAPVKYRGVRIGSVSDISIAPDRRHVGVGLEVSRLDATRLGLDGDEHRLRTELATQGITGVKFVDIDFADPAAPSPPELPFTPPTAFIPSRPSLLMGLQENVDVAVRKLPALLDRSTAALESLRDFLDDARAQNLAARVGALVDNLDAATTDARAWIATASSARIPERAAEMLGDLRRVAANIDEVLGELRGTAALVASAKRATDAIGDVGRSARGTASSFESALHELAESARAVRELAELLERDPDALVRGRAKPRSR
ncbi:MAG: MlaD family protein [Kofleriaceae bacterium]